MLLKSFIIYFNCNCNPTLKINVSPDSEVLRGFHGKVVGSVRRIPPLIFHYLNNWNLISFFSWVKDLPGFQNAISLYIGMFSSFVWCIIGMKTWSYRCVRSGSFNYIQIFLWHLLANLRFWEKQMIQPFLLFDGIIYLFWYLLLVYHFQLITRLCFVSLYHLQYKWQADIS